MPNTVPSPQKQVNSRRQLTLTAALLSMVGPFSINAYLPSFPHIEADFGVSLSCSPKA